MVIPGIYALTPNARAYIVRPRWPLASYAAWVIWPSERKQTVSSSSATSPDLALLVRKMVRKRNQVPLKFRLPRTAGSPHG